MTRRAEILALLPATLGQLRAATGLSGGNLSRVLDDMVAAELIHHVGRKRCYVYHVGPEPRTIKRVSWIFGLGVDA